MFRIYTWIIPLSTEDPLKGQGAKTTCVHSTGCPCVRGITALVCLPRLSWITPDHPGHGQRRFFISCNAVDNLSFLLELIHWSLQECMRSRHTGPRGCAHFQPSKRYLLFQLLKHTPIRSEWGLSTPHRACHYQVLWHINAWQTDTYAIKFTFILICNFLI